MRTPSRNWKQTVGVNITVSFVLATLAIVFAASIGIGLLLYRRQLSRPEAIDADGGIGTDGVGSAVGFVGGAAAFLLGVLMLASLDHYNATKAIVIDEAVAYSGAFESTDGLAAADQATIRRDLICLMRSVATNSWTAAEAGDLKGSDNTHAWRRRTTADVNAAATQTKAQEDSVDTVKSTLISASASGQQRLLAAESDLPLALWILVFVSIFGTTVILTALLRAHPSRTLARASLVTIVAVAGAMLWALTTFDEPFSRGDGVYISPRALNAVMVRLQGTYSEADWGPCESLADN
jgi:hypothetical protein